MARPIFAGPKMPRPICARQKRPAGGGNPGKPVKTSDGGSILRQFNIAFLWLIPKGTQEAECEESILRSPGGTRPLSGANADSNILAASLSVTIDEGVSQWTHHFQRGFLRKMTK